MEPKEETGTRSPGPTTDYLEVGLNSVLGLTAVSESLDEVRFDMPVTPACMQPFGYVHGGATLALLEACASRGAELATDMDVELCFGIHADIAHVKNCQGGTVHGCARLIGEEDVGRRGRKQHWRVEATDDAGDIMSEGTFTTQIVPLDYLASKT